MTKKQLKLLEDYLWKLTQAIGDNVSGLGLGLPKNWMSERVEDLADIFRPIKK
jgi:hypothetical protein